MQVKNNPFLTVFERSMIFAAKGAAYWGYPLRFEKMAFDDNESLWASYTPDYRPGEPLRDNITADLAIIGGGFTGVSTAYHYSKRFPDKKVVLLEAKSLANGASGRNGGMMLNWIYGTEDHSDEMTQKVYQFTSSGMDTIEKIIRDHKLTVSYRRDGCMEVFTKPERAEQGHVHAERMRRLGIPIQFLDRKALKKVINLQGEVYGAVFDPTEGQLNGVQLLRGLRPVLVEQGVQIYEQTPVLKVTEGSTITLTTPYGEVKAKAIVLATNAYTGKLGYFRKAYFPLHSHVFATAPVTEAQMKKFGWHKTAGFADDLNRLSYSTHTREGHIVFGGGSNESYGYSFNNGTTLRGGIASVSHGFLEMQNTMGSYLPGTDNLAVIHRWSGLIDVTFKRNLSMGVIGENKNVYYALGYNGHGVTLANVAGIVLTDMITGSDEQWRSFPFYNGHFAAVPLDPFRWLGYHVMTRVTGRSPRISS